MPTAAWRRAYDLTIYLTAGRWAASGMDPYAVVDPVRELGFTYPPVALLPAMALGVLPTPVAYALWLVALVAASAAFTALVARRVAPRASLGMLALAAGAMAATDPVWDSMTLGQASPLIGLASVAAIVGASARSGVWAGVGAAVKLLPLTSLAGYLARPDWPRRAAWTLLGAVGLTALGWLVFPASSSRYWGGLLLDTGRVGAVCSASNTSLAGLAAHLGASASAATVLGVALTAALGALWTVRVWRGAVTPLGAAVGVSALTTLGMPVSWSHHALGVTAAVGVLVLGGRLRWGLALALVWVLPLWEWAGRLGEAGVALQVVRPLTLLALVVATAHPRWPGVPAVPGAVTAAEQRAGEPER